MQIAVVGTGAIGSVFAYQLAKSGHSVTVVARGARLLQLQPDNAIVLVDGERAPVTVAAALPPGVAYDLVLVTVLAPQVDAVMPSLQASAAKTIMFMFNTFDPIDRLRDGVGAARFAFGFPGGVFAHLAGGKLKKQIRSGTTVTDAAWAKLFGDAGIPSVTTPDMYSWLRSHAAMVMPMMAMSCLVVARNRGITWSEARGFARAMAMSFDLVRALGNSILPANVAKISRVPLLVMTFLFWILSRISLTRELGALGPHEPRMLIDQMIGQMIGAAPGKTEQLSAIRP